MDMDVMGYVQFQELQQFERSLSQWNLPFFGDIYIYIDAYIYILQFIYNIYIYVCMYIYIYVSTYMYIYVHNIRYTLFLDTSRHNQFQSMLLGPRWQQLRGHCSR